MGGLVGFGGDKIGIATHIKGSVGVLVLLFLTPIVNGIAADIAADPNTTASQATIMNFLPTLYVLGILVLAATVFFIGSRGGDN